MWGEGDDSICIVWIHHTIYPFRAKNALLFPLFLDYGEDERHPYLKFSIIHVGSADK